MSQSFYELLLVGSYDAARAVICQSPTVKQEMLTDEDRVNYEACRAEYRIAASRLQAISKESVYMPSDVLVRGMHVENAIALLISGHLGLQGVPVARITMDLIGHRHEAGKGAADVREFGITESYYPGMVDVRSEPDRLPPIEELGRDRYTYSPLCRAAGLEAPDSASWWKRWFLERTDFNAVQVVNAADCLLRVPSLLRSTVTPDEPVPPVPAGGIAEILGVISTMQKDLLQVMKDLREESSRRRLWLIRHYREEHGAGGPSDP